MTEHDKFMKRAIELSIESVEKGGGPFGAVIVKDGKIIAEASNTVTKDNDPTAHAEINAIRQAAKKLNTFDLSGAVIYTSCEPCPMCLGAIYWARIDKIYYVNTRNDAANIGFSDEFIYEELDKPPEERKIPTIQLKHLHTEALKAFKAWEEKEDKIEY